MTERRRIATAGVELECIVSASIDVQTGASSLDMISLHEQFDADESAATSSTSKHPTSSNP